MISSKHEVTSIWCRYCGRDNGYVGLRMACYYCWQKREDRLDQLEQDLANAAKARLTP